jgi:hypothetical protein
MKRTLMTACAVVALAAVPASATAKSTGYGRYCQAESRTHVAGTPGTPFATCVSDMAKLATGKAANPHRVCLNESKRHVAGTKGTPYSQCVSGAERLLKDQATTKTHGHRSPAPAASRPH